MKVALRGSFSASNSMRRRAGFVVNMISPVATMIVRAAPHNAD